MFLLKINVQTRVVVDLKYPSFQVLIDKQIEATDLEWFSLHGPISRDLPDLVFDHRAIHLHCLTASISDVGFDLLHVYSLLAQSLVDR